MSEPLRLPLQIGQEIFCFLSLLARYNSLCNDITTRNTIRLEQIARVLQDWLCGWIFLRWPDKYVDLWYVLAS